MTGNLGTVNREEKLLPVEYRDAPSVEYHDTTDTASCAQIALSDMESFKIS